MEAECVLNNCRRSAPVAEPFCSAHRLLAKAREYVADALDAFEHSDGRELLCEIDGLYSAPKDKEESR